MKRSGPLSRRKRLKPRSAKTDALYVERRKLAKRKLDNSTGENWCQLVLLIHTVDPDHRCGLHLADVHEIKTRARGGSILDDDNTIPTCRPCHDWVGANPEDAQALGLTKWSHET